MGYAIGIVVAASDTTNKISAKTVHTDLVTGYVNLQFVDPAFDQKAWSGQLQVASISVHGFHIRNSP